MKTVFITGTSRGIGKALAQQFLAHGDFVIGTSRAGTTDFEHQNLHVLPLELADIQSREECVKKIREIHKGIDILINNAGVFHPNDEQLNIDVTTLRETLEANLYGPIDLTERLISLLNNGGHIINISSRRGSLDYTKDDLYPCYSISKAALNMFTRKLAARLKDTATVSAVHPGFVKTDMNEGEGDISPEEAAKDIYQMAYTKVKSGQFWHKGEHFSW